MFVFNLHKHNRRQRAFTLIELLVVISIVAILSSIILAALSTARQKARFAAAEQFDSSLFSGFYSDASVIWDFDDDTLPTVLDQSGNNNNISISTANATLSDTVPLGSGKSLFVNSSVDPGSSGNLANPPTTDFSVSFWINLQTANETNILSDTWSGAPGAWLVSYNTACCNTPFAFSFYSPGGGTSITATFQNITTNTWYNVVAQCSGDYIALYVNGVEGTPVSVPGGCTYESLSPLKILANGWGPTPTIQYYIDSIRLYRNALPLSMIEEMYAMGAPVHDLAVK